MFIAAAINFMPSPSSSVCSVVPSEQVVTVNYWNGVVLM